MFSEYIAADMVGHSHKTLRHEDCRGRLCICCGSKLSTSSVMSTSEEALVKEFRPHPAYDRSILSYPTGLCSTCRRSLYKIQTEITVKAWGGPQPSSWAQFNIDSIFGVRTPEGEVLMCDLCVHIQFNPVATIYYKHQDPVLKSRKIEEPPAKQAKKESETNLCSLCLGKSGPVLPTPAVKVVRKEIFWK